MKVIYGTPSTVLVVGVGMYGEERMPFIGFIPRDLADKLPKKEEDEDAVSPMELMAERGTMIFFDNPDAMDRVFDRASSLFEAALGTEWAKREEMTGGVN